MTQLFQSEAAGAFDSSASDLIRMKGYTEAVSAYTAQGKKGAQPCSSRPGSRPLPDDGLFSSS